MFKKNFTWGAATASYQIEGGWNADGKGLGIWDVFSHNPGNIIESHTGDIASDHYHKFKEDVHIMKELGLTAYRFSISWPRILPNGTGKINENGIKFYSELIDELLKNNIEPYITLFHWDYPYELYKKGGWLNDKSVDWFSDYAELIAERFSDKVKYFMTFNEPQAIVGGGYADGYLAPGLKCCYSDLFQICHNILKAHGAAVIKMRKSAKQKIYIGYAPTGKIAYPTTSNKADIEAAKHKTFACNPIESATRGLSWWLDPVFLGKYPEDGLKMYEAFLPQITEDDMKLISQPLDFHGQNIYDGIEVRANKNGEPEIVEQSIGHPKNAAQWPITPKVLYWGPKFLWERYKLPFYITENGMSAHDAISLDGKVHDPNRIDFMHRNLLELEKAAADGVDICGYFHWSLLDNLEWHKGYTERFGLVFVDYETQNRIIKDSGKWYKNWIHEHRF